MTQKPSLADFGVTAEDIFLLRMGRKTGKPRIDDIWFNQITKTRPSVPVPEKKPEVDHEQLRSQIFALLQGKFYSVARLSQATGLDRKSVSGKLTHMVKLKQVVRTKKNGIYQYTAAGGTYTPRQPQKRVQERMDMILSLMQPGTPVSTAEMTRLTGISQNQVREFLNRLVFDGKAEKSMDGSRPTAWYTRLPAPEESEHDP